MSIPVSKSDTEMEEKVDVPAVTNTISSKHAREASWGCDIAAGAICNVRTAQACMNVAAWAKNELLPMQAANRIQRLSTDSEEV